MQLRIAALKKFEAEVDYCLLLIEDHERAFKKEIQIENVYFMTKLQNLGASLGPMWSYIG
jgi:hypothetical protein